MCRHRQNRPIRGGLFGVEANGWINVVGCGFQDQTKAAASGAGFALHKARYFPFVKCLGCAVDIARGQNRC